MEATPTNDDAQGMLRASVRLPQHVVYRAFPTETVALNLETGRYHGLDPVAGRMLEALQEADTIAAAAGTLAEEYDVSPARVERDLVALCQTLLDRGLIEIDAQPGGGPTA